MDAEQIGQIIVILGAAGALLWGFLNHGWPRLTRLWAKGWNWWLLRGIRNEPLDNLDRKGLYELLDMCKEIIKRSKNHALWRQHEKALQLEESVLYRLRYRVRFFLLAESLDRERCASLLLDQNTIQPLFQFELGHVKNFYPEIVDQKISSIPSILKRGAFIEQCEEILAEAEETFDQQQREQPIRIIVTKVALPKNHYLFGHFDGIAKWHDPPKEHWGKFEPNKFWVISLASFEQFLQDIPTEHFILRVMQRACVNAILPVRRKELPDRLSHFSTHGCLFDYTVLLSDTRYFVGRGFICEDCASEILKAEEIPFGHRSNFLHALQKWLVDTQKVN